MKKPVSHFALCVLSLLLLGNTHWTEVDMTGKKCADVQAALNPYLLEDRHHRVKITGTLSASFDQLHRVTYLADGEIRNDGPYAYCFGLIPTSKIVKGYPVSDGSKRDEGKGGLTIWWDAAEIQWDPDGQDLPAVIYVQGDSYVSGAAGGIINGGLTEYGFLDIRNVGSANTDGFHRNRVVAMSADALFESPTTTVGILTFGLMRSNVASLALRINGHHADNDDIGLVHLDSWSTRRTGGMHIRGLHTGVQVYGRAALTIGQAYFPWMVGPDIVLGDPVNGAGVVYWKRCVTGACEFRPRGEVLLLTVKDSVIEGTNYGLVIGFGGCGGCEFVRSYFEQGKGLEQHAILLGAGRCGAADGYRTCGSDSECVQSRVCEVPSNFRQTHLVLRNNALGSNKKNRSVNSLYLGKGATDSAGLIVIEGGIAGDLSPDGEHYYFGYDPAATVKMDLRGVIPHPRKRVVAPKYPHLVR